MAGGTAISGSTGGEVIPPLLPVASLPEMLHAATKPGHAVH